MELIELKTNTRTTTGKGSSRALRREKRIPAILYGSKTEPILLSLEQALLEKVFKTSSTHALIHLIIDDDASNKKTVMIKELQTHPVSRTFLHLDFYEIDMTKKVHVNVPVVTSPLKKVLTSPLPTNPDTGFWVGRVPFAGPLPKQVPVAVQFP